MGRSAKPVKAKVEAKPSVTRVGKSRKVDDSTARQLEARLMEALEQQTATSEILRVISQSPMDVQPVFEAIASAALKLCRASLANVFRFDGDLIHLAVVENANVNPEYSAAIRSVFPRPPGRDSAAGRTVLERNIVAIPDVLEDPDYEIGAQTLIGGFRSVLGVPLMHEENVIGAIVVCLLQPGQFPDSQVALLKTFADQAVIAIENVRLFTQTKEALEQQTATSEILRVISRSQMDVQPVFDTIVAAAMKLCSASSANAFTFDGELIHLVALVNLTTEGAEAIRRLWPRPPGRETAATRAVLTCRAVVVPDVLDDPDFAPGGAAVAGNFRSILAVPLVREGKPIGAIAVGRPQPGPFPDTQIALLQTFADQAVIAIENVRLFNETKEALEQQTATSEILRVISQSQTDVQPVFDTIAAAALELCGANSANVFTIDGGLIHLAARVSSNPAGDEAVRRAYPRPLDRNIAIGRAILTRNVASIPDVLEDPGYGMRETALAVGFRSILAVPLLRDGEPIGAISASRPEPGPFPEKQIALLQIFADQAVIAIANVRLFTQLGARNRDLTEALEQQTATSEILRVISRSQTDVRPVFDTIAKAALELCRAKSANVFTYDGELVHLAAFENENPEYVETLRQFFPRPASRDTAVLRAILTRTVVTIHDVLEDKEYRLGAHAPAGGFRSVLAVPLIREGNAIGGIAVGRTEPGPFPDGQIALLQTFADQAIIAIENVRLFKELEARTTDLTRSVGELKALGEVGQAVSSTLELETVLKTIVSRAVQLTGLDGGSIFEYDERAEEFRLQAAENMPQDVIEDIRKAPTRKGDGALGHTAITLEPTQVPDTLDDSYQSARKELLIRAGYRALLAVPLLREDHLLGGLLVNRKTPGVFAPEVVALLKTFATQSALAIQNARLFREIAEKGRQLEEASRHKSQFLASMSHELRTPLNAILGFNEMILGEIYGDVPASMKEPLEDIQSSGKHLLRLINNVLDLAKIEAGRMELALADYSVQDTVERVRATLRPLAADKGLEFVVTAPADIPLAYGDSGRLTQCLVNLAGNSLKFTKTGKVEVAVEHKDGLLTYRITDTGIGIPPDKIASLFTEFKQTDATIASEYGGSGLGLSITKKFVEMHGGRIWVESELGKGSAFIFEVPLRVREKAAE
jgi:GAF domain-containing protein